MDTSQTRWTCRICGCARLDGDRYRYCPNCGHSRDYDTAHLLTWEEYLGRTPDRYAGSQHGCCGQHVSEEASFCGMCGGSLVAAPPMLMEDITDHGVDATRRASGWSLWIDEPLLGDGGEPPQLFLDDLAEPSA